MGRKIGKNASDIMKRMRQYPPDSEWFCTRFGLTKRQRKEIKRWQETHPRKDKDNGLES